LTEVTRLIDPFFGWPGHVCWKAGDATADPYFSAGGREARQKKNARNEENPCNPAGVHTGLPPVPAAHPHCLLFISLTSSAVTRGRGRRTNHEPEPSRRPLTRENGREASERASDGECLLARASPCCVISTFERKPRLSAVWKSIDFRQKSPSICRRRRRRRLITRYCESRETTGKRRVDGMGVSTHTRASLHVLRAVAVAAAAAAASRPHFARAQTDAGGLSDFL